MSIASMIYDEYNELEFDEESGFYGEGWHSLVKRARSKAIEEMEECPESQDSALTLKFEDGSALYVANPKQSCYDGFMVLIM